MKTIKANTKRTDLMQALVAAYGEGSVITRKQLLDVHSKATASYPHPATVEKDMNLRVGRGQYVVTMSETPAKVRDAVKLSMASQAEQKTSKLLDKKVRSNPAKLAQTIMAKSKTAKKATKEDVQVKDTFTPTLEGPDNEFDDVNELLRVHNNT